jgi:hypothetical protein
MNEQEKSEKIVCHLCGAPLTNPPFSDKERQRQCCDSCYSAEVNAFENFHDPDEEEGGMECDGEEDLEPEDDEHDDENHQD